MEQLALEGLKDQLTPLDKSDYLIKGSFLRAMKEEMERTPVLLFDKRQGWRPGPVQLQLFEPAPQCDRYIDFGDYTLYCHLDLNHKGPHFDGRYYVDWTMR